MNKMPNLAYTATIAGVPVGISSGPIGISLGGGADSSLLLYILMKYCTDPIHIFTLAIDTRSRVECLVSYRVLDFCIKATNNYNINQHIYFCETAESKYLYILPDQFKKLGIVNTMYYGDTANPPLEIVKEFPAGALMHDERDPLVTRSIYNRNCDVVTPFVNIDKKTIAAMYKELNLTDSLFPLTKSCVSNYIKDGHCEQCWFCAERRWGFGRI
jgi:hypothetical protein